MSYVQSAVFNQRSAYGDSSGYDSETYTRIDGINANELVCYFLHGFVGNNFYRFAIIVRKKNDTVFNNDNVRNSTSQIFYNYITRDYATVLEGARIYWNNESTQAPNATATTYGVGCSLANFADKVNYPSINKIIESDIDIIEYEYANGNQIIQVSDDLINKGIEDVDFLDGQIVDNTEYNSAYYDKFNYINFTSKIANIIITFNTLGTYQDSVKGYIISTKNEPHTYYYGVGIKTINDSGEIKQGSHIFESYNNTYDDVTLTPFTVNLNTCTLLKGNHYVYVDSLTVESLLDVDLDVAVFQNNIKYINPNNIDVTFLEFDTTDDYLLWITNDEDAPTPTDITDDIPTDDTPTDDTPTDDYTNDDMDINDIDVAPSNLTKMYKMTSANVENLSLFLWNSTDNVYESIVKNLALQGANPLDAIISLRLFPFNLDNVLTVSEMLTDVSIGRVTATDAKGYKVISIHPKIHLCDFTIDRHYNTFMDYEPYSQYYLYLPFYSTIPLSTKDFLNKNISIDLVVDVINGVANYLVSVNGSIIKTLNCKIAIDIPLSAVDDRQRSNQFINSIMGVGVSAVGLASSNPIAVSSGIAQTLASDFINQNGMSSIINGGLQGSYLNIINPLDIYLLQTHSVYSEPLNYNYQIGYPCESNYKLSSISGKIWVDNADFNNVPCTEVEKNELRNLFKNGVVWY